MSKLTDQISELMGQIPDSASIYNNCGEGMATSCITGISFASKFKPDDTVSVHPLPGGISRGQFTISLVDAMGGRIYSATPLPAGTTQGDYLVNAKPD